MVLHTPQTLDIYGPFHILAPLLSIFVAYAHVAVYSFPRNRKVFYFLTAFYVFAFWVSQYPAAASSTEWGPATDLVDFIIFGSMPFVGIGGMYYFYQTDVEVRELLHRWPAHYICAHQFYRLGGAVFLYLYMGQNMNSYFNLQTGILDITLGVTAIPMALYVRNKPLYQVKTVLLAWHALGLFDLTSAFAFAIGNFFGLCDIEPSPAYIAFFPVTLICYFQVAWAMGIHTMYLTCFDSIEKAQAAANISKKE